MVGKTKILIVDDDRIFSENLSELLMRHGYDPHTTNSGVEALKIVAGDHIELVITDYKMPNMSGYEVIKGVKEIRPEIPVILVTAYGIPSVRVRAFEAGASGFVVKPFEVNEILGALGIALKGIPQ